MKLAEPFIERGFELVALDEERGRLEFRTARGVRLVVYGAVRPARAEPSAADRYVRGVVN